MMNGSMPLSRMAPGGAKKGRKVVRISISRATNGFTSSIEYEPPKAKGKDTGPRWEEPEVNVHESLDSVLALVKKRFGGGTKEGTKEASEE